MSDRLSNHDLNDELLSAYLDGELSADERATIEARLANDPAAQQLLHELRSVSQSVQRLPTESLGRELSEEIIRRAREAKPELVVRGSPDPAHAFDRRSPRSVDSLPRIGIFNSRRAWIWASMALAAGLLMMIVQSGDQRANKLSPVAVHNQEAAQTQPADEARELARREISLSASPSSKSPSPGIVASESDAHEKLDAFGGLKPTAPTATEPRGGESSRMTRDDAAAGPPVAAASPAAKPQKEVAKTVLGAGSDSSTVTALPDQVATDKSIPSPRPTGSVSGLGGALDMTDAKQKSESIVNQNTQRRLVVRVVAKSEALKSGSFDRLLANNNIKFEPQPVKTESRSFAGGKLEQPVKSESALKERLAKSSESPAVEMVLVEAPAPAIEMCLAELMKNENDFLSVNVIEDPKSHDRFDPTTAKKLAQTFKPLSKFNRGNAPVAEKDTIDSRKYFFSYDFDKLNDPVANGPPRIGGVAPGVGAASGVGPETNGNEAAGDKSQPAPEIRRARGVDSGDISNRQAGAPGSPEFSSPKSAVGRAARIPSEASTPNQPMSQRAPNEQAEAKADHQNSNWKVLFVFTSEETPAPSASPDNRPK